MTIANRIHIVNREGTDEIVARFHAHPSLVMQFCAIWLIEQGTTAADIRLQAWAVQVGTSMFVGQYKHLKTNSTFGVKVHDMPYKKY